MRLLCGLLRLDGAPAELERLKLMAAALRSPTVSAITGFWCEGPAGLAVLGFDPAASPVDSSLRMDGSGVLAADVRLDEPAELASELGSKASTDTELAAAALDKWGADAPLHMLGDFALAHWQPRSRELLLARDTAGVRPLVYHYIPGKHFLFASFPRAIHASGLHPRELDEATLARHLLLHFEPEATFSRGVRNIPPGHVLRVSPERLELKRYWQPELGKRRHRTPAHAAEELRELTERAVRSRVSGTGAVAAHLSGGLDSSAITVLAARALAPAGRTLLAYSFLPAVSFPGKEDERPFVEAVLAQEPNIEAVAVPPLAGTAWMHAGTHADFPLNLHPEDVENAVCAAAARAGAHTVLSGWGGDEGVTFNGRGALSDAFLHGRWRYLLREVRALQRERGFKPLHTLRGEVLFPLLPRKLLQRIRRAAGREEIGFTEAALPLLNAHLRAKLGKQLGAPVTMGRTLRRNQLRLLRSAHIASRTTNWAAIGARYGLAFTFPLLDRRLVQFSLSLPPTWHLRDGWKRRVYRDAMDGILPPAIQRRHGKLAPYPGGVEEMLRSKPVLLERISALAGRPGVANVMDLRALREMVAGLPDPHGAEAADSGHSAFLVGHALQAAIFLEQHEAGQHEG